MQEVVTEVGGQWMFDPASELYFRVLNGITNAKIFGRYLPDVSFVESNTSHRVTPATRALWEHWNAYNDN